MQSCNFVPPTAPQSETQSVLERYDITGIFAQKLNLLKGFKLVLILDDSTSMREVLNKGQTKWDELKESVRIVLDIANGFKVECDVLFLNRMGLRNVKNISQLEQQFINEPYGIFHSAYSVVTVLTYFDLTSGTKCLIM